MEAKLFEHYRDLLASNTLMTAEDIKNAYLGLEKQQYSLLELIDYHNTHLKDTLEWGTLKNYFTTQNYAKEFLTERLLKKTFIFPNSLISSSLGLKCFSKAISLKIIVNQWGRIQ